MWLFTRDGFYSVVEKEEDRRADTLTVRARRREDLVALGRLIPGLVIIASPRGDYPFRSRVPRPVLAKAIAELVKDIDYPNFKNTQSDDRHRIYMRIWNEARALE
jgi:hypothetical protein